jgi:hypothetical protein
MAAMASDQDVARLHNFMKERRLGVIATVGEGSRPEAALMDIAVTPNLEIIFETTAATRKSVNLARNPRVCFVIGWHNDQTLQYDGLADQPQGAQLDRIKAFYLSAFPQKASHEFWPGNDYFRARPRWIRLSNYNIPRQIEEFEFPAIENQYPALRQSWWRGFRDSWGREKQRN